MIFCAVVADQCLAQVLVDSMIARSPEQRPTANDVLRHPFFWSCDRQLRFFEVQQKPEASNLSYNCCLLNVLTEITERHCLPTSLL